MLGARKPDPELYERALERYGADAGDAFLVDDNLANIEGARAVGITAHHFDAVAYKNGDGAREVAALDNAIDRFSRRNG
jgi:FMN phosphatase YigB (HAD superfamily)